MACSSWLSPNCDTSRSENMLPALMQLSPSLTQFIPVMVKLHCSEDFFLKKKQEQKLCLKLVSITSSSRFVSRSNSWFYNFKQGSYWQCQSLWLVVLVIFYYQLLDVGQLSVQILTTNLLFPISRMSLFQTGKNTHLYKTVKHNFNYPNSVQQLV